MLTNAMTDTEMTAGAGPGGLILVPSDVRAAAMCEIPAIASHAGAPMRMALRSLRVLLVEDDPGDALLVSLALNESRAPSFAVVPATSMAEAGRHLKEGAAFDVILLDLSLPDSSGMATLPRMQEMAPNVPIVIMTGLDDPRFADQALESGAQDYLVKSDSPELTVVRAIRYAITRMAARIERDALAARVAEQQRVLLKELAGARAMQFDLLPRVERWDARLKGLGLEVEAAFEPSSGIGGDLWGCLDCGGGRLAVYTFDFSGHGIGAALNVFRLHALISERWDPRMAPADFLKALGMTLPGLLGRGQYATMFFGIIDVQAGELEWAAAGAPAPILVEDGEARPLDSRGVPLGLTRQPIYEGRRVPFRPGSTLLLYSDALTDSPKADGVAFGEEALLDLVRARVALGMRISVEAVLDEFFGMVPLPLPDDLTAVRITRTG